MNAATDQTADPIESQTTTALAVVTQSITEIHAFEAGIAELERQYKGVVFKVDTAEGMEDACKARVAIRKPRYAIQKLAKEAKATLNELKKGVDDQAEGYIARISAVEDPVHEQITNEEKRKAAEKETKRLAEQARVAAIQERIDEIRESVTQSAGKPSADIQQMITTLVGLPIDESFAEFKERAEAAKEATLNRLRAAYNNAVALEAEQQRLAAERAELARQKAEQDAAAAKERARIEEENRRARAQREEEEWAQQERLRRQREEEEQKAIERRRMLEEEERRTAERLAAQRAESDRLEAQRKAEREAEEKRLAEQRAEVERQQEALRVQQEALTKASDPVEATASEDVKPAVSRVTRQPEAPERPSDEEIIEAVAQAFFVSEAVALGWIVEVGEHQRESEAA